MSILNSVLGDFNQTDQPNSTFIKINKTGDASRKSSYSEGPKVIYPESTVSDNVILTCGGSVVKIPFGKDLFESMSKESLNQYNLFVETQIQALEKQNIVVVNTDNKQTQVNNTNGTVSVGKETTPNDQTFKALQLQYGGAFYGGIIILPPYRFPC